jgi:predicted nucleic acid-binding protein
LTLLQSLPAIPTIDLNEYLYFIDQNLLYGFGIGFVDINLLASAKLLDIPIWTADKKLREAAVNLKVSYPKFMTPKKTSFKINKMHLQ